MCDICGAPTGTLRQQVPYCRGFQSGSSIPLCLTCSTLPHHPSLLHGLPPFPRITNCLGRLRTGRRALWLLAVPVVASRPACAGYSSKPSILRHFCLRKNRHKSVPPPPPEIKSEGHVYPPYFQSPLQENNGGGGSERCSQIQLFL